jgi:hypothetical protein
MPTGALLQITGESPVAFCPESLADLLAFFAGYKHVHPLSPQPSMISSTEHP